MRELQMIFKEMLLKQLSCNVHFSFLGLFFFYFTENFLQQTGIKTLELLLVLIWAPFCLRKR